MVKDVRGVDRTGLEVAETELSSKRAPRRTVIDTVRVGDWGEVEYRHRMSCGHTIVRKRSSKAPVLACLDCLKAAMFAKGTVAVTPAVRDDDPFERFEAPINDLAVQSSLANLLGVMPESVDLVLDENGNIRYGMIFLSSDDISRLVAKT